MFQIKIITDTNSWSNTLRTFKVLDENVCSDSVGSGRGHVVVHTPEVETFRPVSSPSYFSSVPIGTNWDHESMLRIRILLFWKFAITVPYDPLVTKMGTSILPPKVKLAGRCEVRIIPSGYKRRRPHHVPCLKSFKQFNK